MSESDRDLPTATDYLVVGAGASGLAFADSLIAEDPEVELTLLERRSGTGGHWRDAYPFVRLHGPSAWYGVNSKRLGENRIDDSGDNAGLYERASGAEVLTYLAEVAAELEAGGRVRILTEHEHLGSGERGESVRDLTSGRVDEIEVRRRLVDARYLEASVPATHQRPFEVAAGATAVPVGELPEVGPDAGRYAVLGSGKTAVDACMWLLDAGVEADRIRWVRPREHWFHHLRHFQPLELVDQSMLGLALDAEAAAAAEDLEDLFERLEVSERLVRLDPASPATMYRQTMLVPREIEALRQIEDVVQLGRVERIEPDRLRLERGETPSAPDVVHVDCTAAGLREAPAVPVFEPRRIVIQQVRQNSPCFNSALIAFVEAHRDDDGDRNRLCPPNPFPSSIGDWPGLNRRTWRAEQRWLGEQDLGAWVAASRLNLLSGLPERMNHAETRAAAKRFLTSVGPGSERLREIAA